MDKIDLRGRTGLTSAEAVQLLDQLAAENPRIYEEWLRAEAQKLGLDHISEELSRFMATRCRFESWGSIYGAIVDMRIEVAKRIGIPYE